MKQFKCGFKSRYVFLMIVIISFAFLFYNYNDKIHYRNASFNPSQYSNNSCEFKTNFAFLKTHKTASSTVQNILFRFADKYHRLAAIPTMTFPIQKFSRSMLFGLKPGYKYSVFAQHAIFDYEEMKAVLPDDTKYLTIVRDPAAITESFFRYKAYEMNYGMNIEEIANLNISGKEWLDLKNVRYHGQFGRNQMAFDLGVDPALFDDEEAILEKVHELDRQLDLVMIAELFDQSLILLKEKLCWNDTEDIISFKINARKSESRTRLSAAQKENLRRMNLADQLIYDHFYQKLLRQIDAFGKEKMEEEVRKLSRATKEMYDFCIDVEINMKYGGSSDLLVLRKEAEKEKVCQDLIKDDVPFTLDLITKQKQYYTISDEMFTLIYIGTWLWDFAFKTLYVY